VIISKYLTAVNTCTCSIYGALHQNEWSTVGQLTEEHPQNRIDWTATTVKVADTVWSAGLGVISKTKQKTGSNAMFVQIDQNSATVTPFGSLGSANYGANTNGGGSQSFVHQPNAIRLFWHWICHLFAPA